MTEYLRFVLAGAAVILVFDVTASFISLASGIAYPWFTFGSVIIYLAFGYVAAPRFGHTRAVIGTVVVALTEATFGWAISWLIGPGQVSDPEVTPVMLVATSAIVACLMGSLLGFVGARLALRKRPSEA